MSCIGSDNLKSILLQEPRVPYSELLLPDESNCFMLTSFIPCTKADIVHAAKHNNIYKLCPLMHHARGTNMLNITFLALLKAKI